jgi:periplasmic protein TonB
MPDTTNSGWAPNQPLAGHLSLHVAATSLDDVPFLLEHHEKRIGPAFVVSLAYHLGMALLTFFVLRYAPHGADVLAVAEKPNNNIIWLNEPGPGGGGGGGGNKMKEPPRKAELPGKEQITVPVTKAPKLEAPQETKVEPNPAEQLNIPAKLMASSSETLPGAIDAPPGPPTPSQGSGVGGGAGTGAGSGIGPGNGSGLGPGYGGGTGGGVYRPGNGVTLPRVLREVKPQYTSDAMRAKVQGTVLLECVVRTDGSVTDVQVVRSLDSTFGLDQEAVKAAGQWRFQPGTRMGEPVAVLVTIELTFTLR